MKNESVFQFVNVRPVQRPPANKIEEDYIKYDKKDKSPFHTVIKETESTEELTKKVEEMARDVFQNNGKYYEKVQKLLKIVKIASAEETVEKAKKIIENSLEQDISSYLHRKDVKELKDSAWDLLYAHTVLKNEQPEQREIANESVQIFHFLEFLNKKEDTTEVDNLEKILNAQPIIPKEIFTKTPLEIQDTSPDLTKEKIELEKVYNGIKEINVAIENLKMSEPLASTQEKEVIRKKETIDEENLNKDVNKKEQLIEELIVFPKRNAWLFEDQRNEILDRQTISLLKNYNLLQNSEQELPEIISSLESKKYDLAVKFASKIPTKAIQYMNESYKYMKILEWVPIPQHLLATGQTHSMHAMSKPLPSNETNETPYVVTEVVIPLYGVVDASTELNVIGIGDLLVVKQELQHYAAGEVAHIENVMQSEFKNRTHIRSRETEEIIYIEKEELEESEKDLQTTERFELQKEAEKTIENQMNLDTGLSITGGYGPVSVTASANYAVGESQSEANRTASNFAKQISERSASRVMQKVKEQQTRRSLERFEEKNEHGFDNKEGTNHAIGIYRWVDKYYKAKLINYGRRMMIEFIIPEPASFYLGIQSNKKETVSGITKPEEPMVSEKKLTPTDIINDNYMDFVAAYNVQDVEPPPVEFVYVSTGFSEMVSPDSKSRYYIATSEKLQIPKGYMLYDIEGNMTSQYYFENLAEAVFIAGKNVNKVTSKNFWTDVDWKTEGIVPITVRGNGLGYFVNLLATCELKPEVFQLWQLKTYTAIMNAYRRQLAEYNEQLGALQIQTGVRIPGRNPEQNRKIESDELKKGVLKKLTHNFARTKVDGRWRLNEEFNSMKSNDKYGHPDFYIAESNIEGQIIQFFEQAFEWSNMTYLFYPYFWGRKENWTNIFPITDTDPLFANFLRAGAARVVIPVHPAYNEAVLHYIATDEIWNGDKPPVLDDPLFISIIEELKADTANAFDEELLNCVDDSNIPCIVDEWEIKLPTSLVYLQEDSELPDFSE